MELVDIDTIRRQFTPEELEEAKRLTKKKMDIYKILALVFFLFGGIGIFLPFGKLAQLYTIGYAGLCGNRYKKGTIWALLGIVMSFFIGVISRVFPSINCAKLVYPSNYK